MPLVLSGTSGISTNGINWAIQPDSSGATKLPNQQIHHYVGGTDLSSGGWVTVKPSTAIIANANYSTSTGRFTASVAGTYFFGIWGLLYPADSTDTWTARYMKNGGTIGHSIQGGGNSTNHVNYSASVVTYLSVGDYVEFSITQGGNGVNAYSSQWNQYGWLIG